MEVSCLFVLALTFKVDLKKARNKQQLLIYLVLPICWPEFVQVIHEVLENLRFMLSACDSSARPIAFGHKCQPLLDTQPYFDGGEVHAILYILSKLFNFST